MLKSEQRDLNVFKTIDSSYSESDPIIVLHELMYRLIPITILTSTSI